MKIAVVGVGYVGLVTGACFADLGNDVWCVDVDKEKILNLKQGEIPIYEPGLRELVEKTVGTENLRFTTEINEALAQATICFIAVGTPTGEDGSADLQYVLAVAQEIGQGCCTTCTLWTSLRYQLGPRRWFVRPSKGSWISAEAI